MGQLVPEHSMVFAALKIKCTRTLSAHAASHHISVPDSLDMSYSLGTDIIASTGGK